MLVSAIALVITSGMILHICKPLGSGRLNVLVSMRKKIIVILLKLAGQSISYADIRP